MGKKHGELFVKISEEAKAAVREITIAETKEKLDRGDAFYLVDVRECDEWNRDHLPSAIHLSKGVIERDIEAAIPDLDMEIILYCGGGYRSALAAQNLARMGYTNVYSLAGGWRGWQEAGYPLEKS